MKKSKQQEWAKALESCKKYLAADDKGYYADRCTYICDALLQVFEHREASDETVSGIRDYINEYLDGNSFEEWLILEGIQQQDFGEHKEYLQAHRLAWVNKLIKDFGG